MDLSNEDVLKILKIIDESGYNDIRLEIGDLKLHVQKEGAAGLAAPAPSFAAAPAAAAPAPAPAAAPAPARAAPAAAAPAAKAPLPPAPVNEPLPEGMVAVNSPVLGTFYRASSPGEKPFVEVGQKVGPNDTLCLIEVMKLFNSVKAGVSGTVTRILAQNGTLVEHGQPLVFIQPDA
jgi:acetyl-CoA carboxylase biotin carboxyl carrier protein